MFYINSVKIKKHPFTYKFYIWLVYRMEKIEIFSFTWNCESLKTCKYKSKCTERLENFCSYCEEDKCYIPTFAKFLVEYVANKE